MSGSSLRIVVPALLVIVGSVPVSLPAHAADGTIVVQRQVQPRVAYRPSMVPDPHPTVVDTNVSAEVNALANGAASGNTVSRELGDADFAIVTSGSGIRSMILPVAPCRVSPTSRRTRRQSRPSVTSAPPTAREAAPAPASPGRSTAASSRAWRRCRCSGVDNEAPVRPPPRLRLYRVAPGRPAGLTQSRQHRCQRHLPRQLRPQPGRRRRPATEQRSCRRGRLRALVGSDQRQHLQLDASQPIAASASISGAALRGSGILGVNQGAGLGNQQINAFRLSVSNGPESLDDSVLAQSVALTKVSGSATPVPGGRSVSTDDRAFAGSSGVVQVNQSAGVGNQSMNTLSVRVME